MNNRGQFSIIAALLVSVVIIGAVITTYAAIRYDAVPDQPQVLSAVDETNLALKQLLGFTVGYYGSILKVTGNTTYAQGLARSYLQSGLENIADMKPDWGLTFNVASFNLTVDWFLPTSYSSGNFSVRYDLAGLGFYNLTYMSQSDLNVQLLSIVSGNEARVSIQKEGGEPLTILSKNNFKFYSYNSLEQTWELVPPTAEPVVFANGTYSISVPLGVDATRYLVQVEDTRGIMTVASSYSRFTSAVNWASSYGQEDYVDSISNVDASPDKGTHSNFVAQNTTDGTFDTLSEQIVFDSGQYSTIGYDNQNSFYGGGTSASSISWQHTTGTGSDRILIVAVDVFNDAGTPTTVTSATYNSLALTQVATAYYSGGSLRVRSYVFSLANPSSGNKIININFAASTRSIGGSVTYTNVNQTTPILANNTNTGSGTSLSVSGITASGTNNKVLYGHVGTYRQADYTVSEGVSQTNRWQAGASSNYRKGRGSDKIVTSGSVSMSWTASGTASWAAIAVLLQPTQLYRYELDLEEQFTSVDTTNPNQELCIKTGTLGSEPLNVDVRYNNAWVTVINGLVSGGWNNVSIGQYLSPTFTIRFKGTSETSDSSQTSWAVDAALLRPQSDLGSLLQQQESTTTVEWLQNGTMRWLGQNLQLTTDAMPIPPISAKAFHLNQVFANGTNREVSFQIEDWASEYRVPMGLTSNTTVFSNRQMLVFLLNRDVTSFTLWWDGSDLATQTPLSYVNTRFSDDPASRTLNNGKISLQFDDSFNPVTATVIGTGNSSTAYFMRVNAEESTYGSEVSYVIVNGVVRDVVQQEAEWSDGANNCPNLYSNIVLTLPAGTSFYTYQLRLMFTDSQRDRNMTDVTPIRLTSSISTIQTENGTVNNVVSGTGNFYNNAYASGGWTAHHWSQFTSGSSGAGIMFTDKTNIQLYYFDSLAGNPTGALRTNSGTRTIEFSPVSLLQVSPFRSALDITWKGAIATFDSPSTPIYYLNAGKPAGLWILAEYQPQITVTAVA